MNAAQSIAALLQTETPLKSIHSLSDEVMETIYATGYSLYQGHSLEKATKIFRFLCLYDHLSLKYYLALAACLQMDKQYQEAVLIYSYAALLDIEDPRTPFHAATCHLALGDLTKAASGFAAAIKNACQSDQHQKIRDQATKKLALVRQRLHTLGEQTG